MAFYRRDWRGRFAGGGGGGGRATGSRGRSGGRRSGGSNRRATSISTVVGGKIYKSTGAEASAVQRATSGSNGISAVKVRGKNIGYISNSGGDRSSRRGARRIESGKVPRGTGFIITYGK